MGNALEASAGRVDVMIIGGGPTGIGAAYRLNQHRSKSWILLDAERQPGGLAGSIRTQEGFRFDHGYKTFCSRYEYLDQVLSDCYDGQSRKLKEKSRDSYVYVKGRMVRFPLQNNLSGLPEADKLACALDLVRARITAATKETRGAVSRDDEEVSKQSQDQDNEVPITTAEEIVQDNIQRDTLDEYLIRNWGESLCNVLFRPYIFKSFAHPTTKLTSEWADYKISPTQLGRDIERILKREQCDPGIDFEATTTYPAKGGLVSMWRNVLRKLPKDNIRFKSEIIDLDTEQKTVRTKDGLEITYDTLISTMPLTSLLELAGRGDLSESLIHSSLYIICLGIRGASPHKDITGCIYFPESDCVFHRACVFSSFDPDSVPDKDQTIPTMRLAREDEDSARSGGNSGPYWSLMMEVSAGPLKTISDATIMNEAIRDACLVGLLRPNDEIVSIHMTEMTHGQPLPTPESKEKVDEALKWLQTRGIYSRGRFGAFKYHLGDLDHCFIQGVEAADNIVTGASERCLWASPADINCAGGKKIPHPAYDLGVQLEEGEGITAGDVRNAITREPSTASSSFVSSASPISRTSSQRDDLSHLSDSEVSVSPK